ncbi:MAG: glycosyltransferase family 4 protein [Microthrixaceae bacterium]
MAERGPVVLCVLPGLTPDGGTEQSFVATAGALVEAGVVLHLAVLTDRQELVPVAERAGVVVHDLSAVRPTVPRRAASIRALARRTGAELIHASLHDATIPTQLAAVTTRLPVLVSWVNVTYGASRRGEAGVSPAGLEALRLEETVLGRLSRSWYQAVTPEVGRLMSAAVRAPASRVLLGERGRDPALFPFRGNRPGPVPTELGLPEGAAVVLAVGRQEPQKGYERLLPAFESVAARHPSAHLVVAGRRGAASADLDRRRAASPVADRIHFLGQCDDVAGLLRCADVMVCTSRREGAAGALVEAMAVGAPLVALPVPGLDGVLVDGRNSLVVPEERLAGAIGSVLDDPEAAAARAEAARREFESRFTMAASARRLGEIYRTVAHATGGGSGRVASPGRFASADSVR